MIILFVIGGGLLIFFLLTGLFELISMIERRIPVSKKKIKAAAAVSVEAEKPIEPSLPPPTAEEKLQKHKERIDASDLDQDAKKASRKHAERKYGKTLKDMIDES